MSVELKTSHIQSQMVQRLLCRIGTQSDSRDRMTTSADDARNFQTTRIPMHRNVSETTGSQCCCCYKMASVLMAGREAVRGDASGLSLKKTRLRW